MGFSFEIPGFSSNLNFKLSEFWFSNRFHSVVLGFIREILGVSSEVLCFSSDGPTGPHSVFPLHFRDSEL